MFKNKEESQTVEFKESWNDDYIRNISAFANSKGGILYIGVKNNGAIIGIEPAQKLKKLLEDIPNKISQRTQLHPVISTQKEGDKRYLVIEVEPSPVPVACHGHFYIRSGSVTTELQGSKLREFIRNKDRISWDSEDAGYDKYFVPDEGAVAEFRELASKRLPEIRRTKTVHSLLRNLNLLTKEGHLTRAAVLLFDKYPQKLFPSLYVKIGRFLDPVNYVSTDIIEGNLFQQVRKAIEILRTKYLVSEVSFNGIYRQDLLIYPENALREALLNAVIHRLNSSTACVTVKVYNDRLSISNIGTLPEGLTIKDLKGEHPSIPRNPLIARVFYHSGLIETWGRGTLMILEACKEQKLPRPKFHEKQGCFETVFYRKDGVTSTKTSTNISTKTNTKTSADTSTKNQILEAIKANPHITGQQIADQLEIGIHGVRYHLAALKRGGILHYVGSSKSGHWEIIES